MKKLAYKYSRIGSTLGAIVVTGGILLFSISAQATTITSPPVTPALVKQWYQWAFSIPATVHPLVKDQNTAAGAIDPSSNFCAVGQSGTWFLGGFFKVVDFVSPMSATAAPSSINGDPADVTRECEIPLGATVLMQVLAAECDTAGEISLGNLSPNATYAEKVNVLSACVSGLADLITVAQAEFGAEGQTPTALPVTRVTSPQPFSLTYAPDNVIGIPVGSNGITPDPNPSLAMTDGYWTALRPQTAGTYELVTLGDVPSFGFKLKIKYRLTFVPPREQ